MKARSTPTMTTTSPKRRLKIAGAACAAALLMLCFAPETEAQFEPDLGETMDWLVPPDLPEIYIPPGAAELTRYPMSPEPMEEFLDELPGRPFHDLESPPESSAWWKYPIYTVFGLPRDLVDSFFGAVSYLPIFGTPIVGVAYELVPTQAFFRDPRDWHPWIGGANKKGHGWSPSKHRVRRPGDWVEGEPRSYPATKIDGNWTLNETWGFFPTSHAMKFTYVSKRKVKRLGVENDRMREELLALNEQIDARNQAIAGRQRVARNMALAAIDTGDGFEATSRMLPYHLAYPTDDTAFALLINALAVYGDDGAPWVRPLLWQSLSRVGGRSLTQTQALLATSNSDFPDRLALAESRVFVQTRAGDIAGALVTAQRAYAVNPADQRRSRLYFETSLTAREGESAAQAMAALEGLPRDPASLEFLRLRYDLLGGRAFDARDRLIILLNSSPENAYYHYYLGCAELALVDQTDRPERSIMTAFDELERASLTARSRPLRDRVGRALSYARRLASRDAERRARPERGSFFDFPALP